MTFTDFINQGLNDHQKVSFDEQEQRVRWVQRGSGTTRLSTREFLQSDSMIARPTQELSGWALDLPRWLDKAGVSRVYDEDMIANSRLSYPTVSAVTTKWLKEGESVTDLASVNGGALEAYPATIGTGIEYSRAARASAHYDLAKWLEFNISRGFEKSIQSGLLTGNGGAIGEIQGILTATDLAGEFSDTPSYQKQIADAMAAITTNGAVKPFVVVHPDKRATLMRSYSRDSGDTPIWQIHSDGNGNTWETFLGVPAAIDDGLPLNTGVIGDFAQGAMLVLQPETEFRYRTTNKSGKIELFAFLDAAAVVKGSMFCKLTFTV